MVMPGNLHVSTEIMLNCFGMTLKLKWQKWRAGPRSRDTPEACGCIRKVPLVTL